MTQDHDHLSPASGAPPPTAADFDQPFTAAEASPGLRRVWALAEPELPPQIDPTSFITLGLLGHVVQVLDLSPGETLVDLACGRGGPGLWLAREADVSLVGVDFSPVAVGQVRAAKVEWVRITPHLRTARVTLQALARLGRRSR